MPDEEPCWDRFLIEGDESFDFMRHNFESMFDGESRIKQFEIRYDVSCKGYTTDEIYKEHGKDIEQELISWIRAEYESNRLFDKEKWKPFRDYYLFTHMYLGYRNIFQYKQYIFQLAVDWYCTTDGCVYCKDSCEALLGFQLALCGIKDDNDIVSGFGPDVKVRNNIMPDCWWGRK